MKKHISIVFVCVGNACRSQMAEGFARFFGPKNLEVCSAGSRPCGFVAPESVRYMKEKGIDLSGHYSKGIPDLPKIKFDYVVTMGCGDDCPLVPAVRRLDWDIPDPIGATPEFFRSVRDLIEEKVRDLLTRYLGHHQSPIK